jgi:hypothetical protein
VIAAVLVYTNVFSEPSEPRGAPKASDPAPAAAAPAATSTAGTQQPSLKRAGSRARSSEDFHPTLKPGRPEDRPDPATIDPTLRLDLLAKVQAVEAGGNSRNLFQFSAAPPPPLPKGPEPVIKVKGQVAAGKTDAAAPTAGKPAAPPPAPITLKYYGFSTPRGGGRKTAFFLDGEEILIAAEGDVVQKRYKVIRIGIGSVVMQDTESKTEQTVPLQEEVTS